MVEAAARSHHRPARVREDGDLPRDPGSGTLNVQPRIARRPGVPARRRQGRARTGGGAIPRSSTCEFLERFTTGFERVPRARRGHAVGGARAPVAASTRTHDPRRRAPLPRRVAGRSSAGASGVTQQEHGVDTVREIVEPARCCAATSGARARAHRRCAGTATCRATGRAASTIARPRRSSTRLDAVCGDRVAARARAGHGAHHRGHARRRREGLRRAWAAISPWPRPDTTFTIAALRTCDLTVQVSTKLNRSHLVHGTAALILPCLGAHRDATSSEGRLQGVSVEDAMAWCISPRA